MADVFFDALLDTLKLLPFLVLIYVIIELLEHKTNINSEHGRLRGGLGPLIGSATGLIPQCGFSVMAAKLYEQKYITIGTLLAIFLSTSDEAFVILLSEGAAGKLLPLIIVKMAIGVSVGVYCGRNFLSDTEKDLRSASCGGCVSRRKCEDQSAGLRRRSARLFL